MSTAHNMSGTLTPLFSLDVTIHDYCLKTPATLINHNKIALCILQLIKISEEGGEGSDLQSMLPKYQWSTITINRAQCSTTTSASTHTGQRTLSYTGQS